MTKRSHAAGFTLSTIGMLALAGLCTVPVRAQEHRHAAAAPNAKTSELVKVVREVTAPFQSVAAAENAGYALQFGCVSGPDAGAMGLHYVNFPLVTDGEIDATHPEIILYEAVPGGLRLAGADYLVLADQWDKTHPSAPELMGQKFHQFEAPNRFGLPRFYTLHVWAWKDSPTGTFVNWNTSISCDAYSGQKP